MTILKFNKKPNKDIDRRFFIDKYNNNKIWGIAFLKGALLLTQFLKNKDGIYNQLGRGSRRNRKELKELGVFNFQEITDVNII